MVLNEKNKSALTDHLEVFIGNSSNLYHHLKSTHVLTDFYGQRPQTTYHQTDKTRKKMVVFNSDKNLQYVHEHKELMEQRV